MENQEILRSEKHPEKLIGIVRDIPTEITDLHSKKDLASLAAKHTRKTPSLSVKKLTLESEYEYELVVFHGQETSYMDFKVDTELNKMQLLECRNCQKCGMFSDCALIIPSVLCVAMFILPDLIIKMFARTLMVVSRHSYRIVIENASL